MNRMANLPCDYWDDTAKEQLAKSQKFVLLVEIGPAGSAYFLIDKTTI